MRYVIAMVMVLFTASIAGATENAEVRSPESVVPAVTEQVTQSPELILAPVAVEKRAADSDEIAQDMPQRGSFWWIVGAIVVAGVILAVVL